MSKAKTGALVRYCGHRGVFYADIFEIGGANVIRCASAVTPDNLDRQGAMYEKATHHIVDFPNVGFWRPDLGVFVIPASQCKDLQEDLSERTTD